MFGSTRTQRITLILSQSLTSATMTPELCTASRMFCWVQPQYLAQARSSEGLCRLTRGSLGTAQAPAVLAYMSFTVS
jgi:hypothetical protein